MCSLLIDLFYKDYQNKKHETSDRLNAGYDKMCHIHMYLHYNLSVQTRSVVNVTRFNKVQFIPHKL